MIVLIPINKRAMNVIETGPDVELPRLKSNGPLWSEYRRVGFVYGKESEK